MTEKDYNLERLKFLIVDDNSHMRALVRTILHTLGSKNCHEATDGENAIEELRHFSSDIIICDWNMSPLDGLEFVKLIRTGEGGANPFVPIIMLTSHTEMSKVLEARDSGVHEYLAKPISAKSLYSRIKMIIENPRDFVNTETYFGPDRRRIQIEWPGDERRKDVQDGRVTPLPLLSKTESLEEGCGEKSEQDMVLAAVD